MFRAVGRVVVGVSDQDEALAFYRDVLGFEVLHDSDDEGLRYLHIGLPTQPDTGLWLMPGAAEHDRPLLVLYADDLEEIAAALDRHGRAGRGMSRDAGLYLAWLAALAATLGALFVGEVLGQEPCHLCWWQRVAMFPLAVILGLACLRGDLGVWRYALPLALAGAAVALYHSGLYLGLIPEPIEPCSRTGPAMRSTSSPSATQ